MKYASGQAFLDDPNKCLVLMGLSGVGKTTACRMLPSNEWFHYSVDYRIWTHYLGDQLNDYLKNLALQVPSLHELLMKDAISIEHRVHFDNLFATSVYMGMLGNPKQGGSDEDSFEARMTEYADAEIAAMLDVPKFMARSEKLYAYPHFLVDASGSLCEICEPDDPNDAVVKLLEDKGTVVYIEATEAHKQELLRRQAADPKPIYYRADFIENNKAALLKHFKATKITELDPKEVSRFLYPRLLKHRIPRYEALAARTGYSVPMTDILKVQKTGDLLGFIAKTIDATTQR